MAPKSHRPRKPPSGKIDTQKLDAIVAKAHKDSRTRMQGYREQSLKLYPHVCARCARDFTAANLQELTVHHKDHNHDNNPPDGSNWENLCLYCHDWEHQKYSQFIIGADSNFGVTTARSAPKAATFNPFAGLKDALDKE